MKEEGSGYLQRVERGLSMKIFFNNEGKVKAFSDRNQCFGTSRHSLRKF